MPIPVGVQLYITSADGTKRRRLPIAQVESVSTTIDRFGGYGQGTVSTAIPYNQAGSLTVLPGDRVETWYEGSRRYRGYVSALQPSSDEPRKVVIQCYGASAILRKQFTNKAYAFPSGGVDVAEAFAALAHDFLLHATGPGGFPLVQSTQILPIATTIQSLDARRKLAGDVLDALVKEAGNLAVWGVDVDANGNNRLYLRPLSPAAPPTHAIAVPGRNVETATGELQTADIVNQLTITGGAATYPNLLHNGGYELPVQQADGAGNLVVNGGFDLGTGSGNATAWALNSGAAANTPFSFPPKSASAYTGNRFLQLEGTGQNAVQVTTAALTAGHNYCLSVRAAKEIDQQISNGHALLQVYSGANGAGNLLASQTVSLTPSGQGYDYFSGTLAAPAGSASFRVTLACDTNDSSHVPNNDGYSGGLLIDDVQLYDVSVVYQDGWYVDVIDQISCRVNAVNWVYEDSAFEGGYCVYLDATGTDSDGHDLKLQPLETARFKVAPAQTLRAGVWLKSPPSSLNPQPPKFNLEIRLYDSSGNLSHTPRTTFTPGFLASWTYFELVCYAIAGEVSADANLTWRSAGSLLVDAFSVRDEQAPAMAAASGSTAPLAPYLPDGPLVYFITASDPYLNGTWRPANGYAGAAPYANSEAVYGPRCGTFSDSSVLLLSDAMAVANGAFLSQASQASRPSVTLVNDPRLFWPGETMNLIGADGPQLSPSALPLARVVDTYDGLLKTRLESQTEQPDVALAVKKIVQAEINRLGPGQSGGASGGGYSGAAGGGASTTPAYRTSLQASSTDPTLHDAFTGAPHASQASQAGWSGTSAEVVAGRTRTVKAVSSTSLEGRLDAMEVDIAAKEPVLGSPGADGYVLSSTAAGARSWAAPQSGPAGPQGAAGPTGATGPQGPAGNTGAQGPAGNTGPAGTAGATGAQGPAGATGAAGPAGTNGTNGTNGAAATVGVGTTATGAAGSAASVTNSGTSSAATFNFTIPAGATGATGPAGPQGTAGTNGAAGATGPAGANGAAASVSIGTTTTLAAGAAATVTNTGTSSAAVFNFGIPQGAGGAAGTGGVGSGASNYFGSGADGGVTISANTTWDNTAAANDTGLIVKNFTSLTIQSGATVTAAHRSQVMLVYVSGDCTIAGNLNMDAKGAAATPASDMVIRKYLAATGQYFSSESANQTVLGLINAFTVPAAGAAGAVGTTSSGVVGANGTNGQTGGGGAGGSNGGTSAGGHGAAGTAFCGGSGGGAGGYGGSSPVGKPAAANGGAGGAGGSAVVNTSAYVFAGGAGNLPGAGTATGGATAIPAVGGGGGTIILVVKGNLTISGTLSAAGAAGGSGSGTNSGGGVWGGGGAGGGSLVLLYGGAYSHSGAVSAVGGAGGLGGAAAGPTSVSSSACSGGAGGAGSVQTIQIQNS